MKVTIKNDKKNTLLYKWKLKRKGFLWIETSSANGYWEKDCTKAESKAIQRFCKRKGLKAIVYEKNYSRNDYYRKAFLNHNKGLFDNGRFYICVYCGKIVNRKKVTVDHLIPVDKVLQGKHKEKYRRKLKRQGISNVNQVENLVPACYSCNSKKSNHAGVWVIRGKIGRITWLWIVRWQLRLYIAITILGILVSQSWFQNIIKKLCGYGLHLYTWLGYYIPIWIQEISVKISVLQQHINLG